MATIFIKNEANKGISKVNKELYNAHQACPKMTIKIKRMDNYWSSMIRDCINYTNKYHICQIHGDIIYQLSNRCI